VVNQIAAGEVVARPASVVKELVENALDAGARSVLVDIESGGVGLVRVVDDGHGMSARDAVMALARHATSKLRSVEDLHTIATLGFRGEALPSIAAVSRFALRTRRADEPEGTAIRLEGGGEPRVEPCAAAVGTTVEVRDLFFNVPARRKFLRALTTESAHVGEVLRQAALGRPAVRFQLGRDGRVTRRLLPVDDLGERVRDVLGTGELTACHGERGPVAVAAFLGPPARARSGATGLYLLVNGRPVQDRALARAVAAAHGERLERGQYPVGAVFVSLPSELVDVNVHPQKAEVRFAHARAVSDALYAVVAATLGRGAGAAADPPRPPAAAGLGRAAETKHADAAAPWHWSGRARALDVAEPGSADPASTGTTESAAAKLASGVGRAPRLIGRARNGSLVCEDERGLLVLDPGAVRAHLLAIETRRQLAAGDLDAQLLLFPVVLPVSSEQAARCERDGGALGRWGFDLRRSGRECVSLYALARLWAPADPVALGRLALAALPSNGRQIEPAMAAALCERACALAAAGDREQDDRELVARWYATLGEVPVRERAEVVHQVAFAELAASATRREP
jgi:DNA mismatch repair protein MutL